MTEAHGNWIKSSWGKPFYFFFYYLPNRFAALGTKESLECRRNVFDFKDGKAQDKIIDLVEKKLTEHFPETDDLTLVCIPASTKNSNSIRYEKFSSQVCTDLKMHNAFRHIAIIREKTPSHLGGGDKAEFQLDPLYLKGKRVVLFDDVVTRGRSMQEFSELLESVGAHVVACMSIAKTYYPADEKQVVLHPWSGGFVKLESERESHLNKRSDSFIFQHKLSDNTPHVSIGARPMIEIKHNYRIGEVIKFGAYAGRKIEWQVLECQSDRLLVISRYGLLNRPFNNELKEVSWASSSIRKWLNKEFFQSVFSNEEKERVIEHSFTSDDFEEYGLQEKFQFKDRVSLLSVDEYLKYFRRNLPWRCLLLPNKIKRQCWLRTTGEDLCHAAFIGRSGRVHANGSFVNSARNAVRPVLWLKV